MGDSISRRSRSRQRSEPAHLRPGGVARGCYPFWWCSPPPRPASPGAVMRGEPPRPDRRPGVRTGRRPAEFSGRSGRFPSSTRAARGASRFSRGSDTERTRPRRGSACGCRTSLPGGTPSRGSVPGTPQGSGAGSGRDLSASTPIVLLPKPFYTPGVSTSRDGSRALSWSNACGWVRGGLAASRRRRRRGHDGGSIVHSPSIPPPGRSWRR